MKSEISEQIIAEALRSVEKHHRRKSDDGDDGIGEASQQDEAGIVLDPEAEFGTTESEGVEGTPASARSPVDTGAEDGVAPVRDQAEDDTREARRRISKVYVKKLRARIRELVEERSALEVALEEKEREANRHYQMALRAAADLENYRKRTAREKRDLEAFGIEKFLRELLPVVDNLERALQHAEQEARLEVLLEGVRMTLVQLSDCLGKFNVTRVESHVGMAFDPAVHEAMWEEETDAVPPNTIAREVLPGYKLHDRLLRASLVSVARAPARPTDGASHAGGGASGSSSLEDVGGDGTRPAFSPDLRDHGGENVGVGETGGAPDEADGEGVESSGGAGEDDSSPDGTDT